MTAPSKTRMDDVYRRIRYSIMMGALVPGQRVKLGSLCDEYQVSLSVVREAATRLAEQGLLKAEPNRGFRVPSLRLADLQDLTFVRVEIESLCLERAIDGGDTAWEAGIVAAHHTLVRVASREQDVESDLARTQAHAEFHQALAAGCSSPRLLDIRQSLFDSSELYRHWSLIASAAARDPAAEHREIMEAALSRDKARALEWLIRHIRGTADWLASSGVKDADLPFGAVG